MPVRAVAGSVLGYYIQVKVDYAFTLNRYQCVSDHILRSPSPDAADSTVTYRLTAENKVSLVRRYRFTYPELTMENIPDEVELISYDGGAEAALPLSANAAIMAGTRYSKQPARDDDVVTVQFSRLGATAMSALHHILVQTPLNEQLPNALPPFTAEQLKAGLRTSWTAEQISQLAVKYESEWYADASLSKWDEINILLSIIISVEVANRTK